MLTGRIEIAEQGIKQFGEDLPDIANLITNAITSEYAEYVRDSYLRGQVLQAITGETLESVRFFKVKETVRFAEHGVRPGAGIRGRLNYLVGLARKGYDFMGPSAEAFAAANRPQQIADRVMAGIIRRGGYRT